MKNINNQKPVNFSQDEIFESKDDPINYLTKKVKRVVKRNNLLKHQLEVKDEVIGKMAKAITKIEEDRVKQKKTIKSLEKIIKSYEKTIKSYEKKNEEQDDKITFLMTNFANNSFKKPNESRKVKAKTIKDLQKENKNIEMERRVNRKIEKVNRTRIKKLEKKAWNEALMSMDPCKVIMRSIFSVGGLFYRIVPKKDVEIAKECITWTK